MRSLTLAAAIMMGTAITSPVFAADDAKISDEPLNLSIHLHWARAQKYNDAYPVELAAREKTNIFLNDATIGANTTDSQEAFNLLLASGKMPDIVGGARIKDNVNQYGPQGAFLPLNDLIKEHAPNLQAFFDAHPDLLKAASAADGNLYYVPYFPDGKFGRGYFIRQDWLDKLGLKAPENVDEVKAVLEAFRDQDPNGNGKKDEIPYFVRQWEELIRLVTLWDGRSTGSDTYHDFMVQDDAIVHPYALDGYREGMKNIAQWYKEGLIDAEVFTRGSSARDYLLSEDLGGMTHDWFASTAGYNDSLQEKVPGFSFVAFVPPASVSGVRMEEHRRIAIKPEGWAIGYANEHPVETIKYFDFWFSPDGRNMSNFGVEGQHWDMVDGKATFKPEILNNGQAVNSQMYEAGAQILRGYWMDYNYEVQWTGEEALKGIELYEQGDYLIDDFLGVSFNVEEQAVYDKFWPSIRTYMLERQQAWILGSGDVEADWDGYISTLNKMGYDQVVEVMTAAYKRQYQ
ncbi:extracellular solute-binding protein [Albirhodobacter sp. R86504]|jgi:putative aldouronate transport system substrate-binding protein|uniref:extracellular solute-binding protein n=1 Tax=Albirhodobacter sp. R86504 TaxID=3093848 RepID=UPI00366E3B0A